MNNISPKPTGPSVSPAAAGQSPGLGIVGPQPKPDPWTVKGSSVWYAYSLVIGNPTGGQMGDGTINAVELYINGSRHNPAMFAQLIGATFTGPVVLAADPTTATQAATKRYVDNHIAAIPPSLVIGDAPPASPYPGQLWWASAIGQLFVWYVDPNTSQWVVCNNALNSISLDMGGY